MVCSDPCARKRNDRLRKVKRRANIATACSECGAEIKQASVARPFLTCSPECFDKRNKRLKAEKYIASRPTKKRYCIDCSTELPPAVHARTARCDPCATTRRRQLHSEQRTRRQQRKKSPENLSWSATAKPTPRQKLDNRLRSLYGIGVEDYEAMIEAQAGLCAICLNPPKGRGRGGLFAVDHDHKHGHVRSLLCGKCNIAIGLMGDDPAIIDRAAAYLRRWTVPASTLQESF